MPIEFRCSACNALLRVPDDRAGKPVRCPHCQGVMAAPAPPSAEPAPNPFADRPLHPPPHEINPYAAPASSAYDPVHPYGMAGGRAAVAEKVKAPAIGMMVYAGLALMLVLSNLVIVFAGGGPVGFGPPPANEQERMLQTIGVFIGAGVAAAIMVAILVGAWKMLKLESYGMAMAASILSLLPCSLCCLLGLPFGIWGLVVLNDPEVKALFFTPQHARGGVNKF